MFCFSPKRCLHQQYFTLSVTNAGLAAIDMETTLMRGASQNIKIRRVIMAETFLQKKSPKG
jgi:hypothetical protein